MQSPAVVISDIKALLTLLLLKTGTTSAEIRTSLQFASTWRAMAGDDRGNEPAGLAHPANNVARLYPNSDAETAARNMQLAIEAMNSDVMALLTLSLLKTGSTSEEIQKALHLAALSRATVAVETPRSAVVSDLPEPSDPFGGDPVALALKQALLNELLVSGSSHGAAMS
jgi:hypothetical protein